MQEQFTQFTMLVGIDGGRSEADHEAAEIKAWTTILAGIDEALKILSPTHPERPEFLRMRRAACAAAGLPDSPRLQGLG